MFENHENQDSYTEICGCRWRHGKRVHVCPEHKHKHGIRPDNTSVIDRYTFKVME